MPLNNEYYVALEPFQILRATGSRPSNNYIGRSQVIETIYEEVEVRPGDELHDLVGGLFHIDSDGKPHESRLTKPPHIFEAHHHRGAESARKADLLRDEFIWPEDDPRKVEKYRA